MVADQLGELLQDQQRVTKQAVAYRRGCGQMRIRGDLQQLGALRQILTGNVRVITEDLSADDDHEVVPTHDLGDTGDGHRQLSLIQRVILGERRPVRKRAAVRGRVDLFREGHSSVPGPTSVHFGSEDQHGPLGTVDPIGEPAQPLGIGADAVTDGAHHRRPQGWLVPVVERNGQEYRSRGRLQGSRVGAHERSGHVLGAGGLIGPLHPRLRKKCLVLVGQIRVT